MAYCEYFLTNCQKRLVELKYRKDKLRYKAMKYKGMGYLKNKLAQRRSRCETRYDYYEMKNKMRDISTVIPAEFRWLTEFKGG